MGDFSPRLPLFLVRAEGLLDFAGNPMLLLAAGIGAFLVFAVLLVIVSGGGQRTAVARDGNENQSVGRRPLPPDARRARLAMYLTGGLILPGVLLGLGQSDPSASNGMGFAVGCAYGIGCIAAGIGLRNGTRGAYVTAVALQLLLFLPSVVGAVWTVVSVHPAAILIWVIPLALSANALNLLFRCRDFYLRPA